MSIFFGTLGLGPGLVPGGIAQALRTKPQELVLSPAHILIQTKFAVTLITGLGKEYIRIEQILQQALESFLELW